MRILIAGANGKTGRRLTRILCDQGHAVRALIRDPEQAGTFHGLGAEPVVGDLETGCGEHLAGCQAVVFAAGSGPHTGPDKTLDVDRDGAIRLIDSTARQGIDRFVMLSAMRTEAIDSAPEKLRHYLEAKKVADDHLRASGLEWTIIKPGRLTENPGRGRIRAAEHLDEYGEISREDVAATLAVALTADNLIGRQVECIAGEVPIAGALAAIGR